MNIFNKQISDRIYNFLIGSRRFKANYRFVLNSQWFPHDKIERYQNKHLHRIVRYAYEQVPYYRKMFDQAGVRPADICRKEDLAVLPILRKQMVKENFEQFRSRQYHRFHPSVKMTSGSTGKPLRILIDRSASSFITALLSRRFNWAGCRLTDRIVKIAAPFGFREGNLDTKNFYKYTVESGAQCLWINTGLISHQTLPEIYRRISEFKPVVFATYPSVLTILIAYLRGNEEFKIRPRVILTGGEKMYPFQREEIKNIFSCDAFENYSQWENISFADECERHNLHSSFEIGITEIIKDGKPCRAGEVGELVATGLRNYSMPLIRYATEDFGCYKDIECSCGRKSKVIEIVGSREKDLIVTEKGIFHMMSGYPVRFKARNKIEQIQFYQDDKKKVTVKIVRRNDFSDDEIKEIEADLRKYLLDSADVKVMFVEAIPRTAAGKYKYVESKIPVTFD